LKPDGNEVHCASGQTDASHKSKDLRTKDIHLCPYEEYGPESRVDRPLFEDAAGHRGGLWHYALYDNKRNKKNTTKSKKSDDTTIIPLQWVIISKAIKLYHHYGWTC
jgi:hypothetical protein